MAEAILVKTVIFDEGLYRAHGDIGRWVTLITRHFGEHAVRYAPIRSGELKAGIHWSSRQIGTRQVEGAIQSDAPHTLYVLRGTTGPIMTNLQFANPGGARILVWRDIKGKDGISRRQQIPVRVKGHYMPIPEGLGFDRFFATEVSGQHAQNFLLQAWRATARNHRAIRGVIPTFIGRP